MNLTQLLRMGGLLLIISAFLLAIGMLIHPPEENSAAMLMGSWVPAHTLLFIGSILALIGFSSAFGSRVEKMGAYGFTGYAILFAGFSILAGITYSATILGPLIAEQAPQIIDTLKPSSTPAILELITIILLSLGGILFSISAIIRRTFSIWASSLLLLGSLIIFFGFIVFPGFLGVAGMVIFSVGQMGVGYNLWKSK